jgi:mono/diheme cytochrome c family protein
MVLLLLALIALTGCRKSDMAQQQKYEPLEPSDQFVDGKSARPLINGTVPRGGETINDSIYAVSAPGPEAEVFPFPLTRADLERGQQQFTIFCSMCHGQTGAGDGMIVQRGFPHPPSYYLPRLREAKPGHFYNVITHGYGAMYSYGDRVAPLDRWRIAGYIRALQLSDPTNNGLATTPPAQRK